ncbi:sporulation protein [Bacillus luteolus]|uniref:Sporulation protein n=1 Tax=Litchfieldia luteola TaxID=682179 RepID=A0ABR9QGG0_9BACI|nr:sporulation protein [Cytobacillus luteolus]MBE4907516.1 sporulation protein [Cytobacillus luteolus]MBP1944285.1 sporulation-control protein [Cytobacillus luteolus]
MILRKYLSLLGIGSARIDLILPKEKYRRGEDISGHFLIHGGTIEQKIRRIDCDLVMLNEVSGVERLIDSTTVLTSKKIDSDESNKMAFTFSLPKDIPVSSEAVSYRFKTRLTFNEGVESKDQDRILVTE